jgi:hypothetical protein
MLESATGAEARMLGLADVLAVFSGSLVGFALGLVGGGGSILAVPLCPSPNCFAAAV